MPELSSWRRFFQPPFKVWHGQIMEKEGHKLLDVRGWGRLTGRGQDFFIADNEDAGKVQDEMAEWVRGSLEGCYNLQHPDIDLAAIRKSAEDLTSQVRDLLATLKSAGLDKDETNAADIEDCIKDLEERLKSLPETRS